MSEKKSGRYAWIEDESKGSLNRKQMVIGHVKKTMDRFGLTRDDMEDILDMIDAVEKARAAKEQA